MLLKKSAAPIIRAFALLSMTVLLGCGGHGGSNDSNDKPAPNTGNQVFEDEKTPDPLVPPGPSTKVMYVYTTQLNVRSQPVVDENNIVGRLGLNDEVKVVSVVANSDFDEITIVKTDETIKAAAHYYVARQYLSTEKNEQRAHEPRSRYFMIQNVATEKLRVYERGCESGSCPHKLILEADVAVGQKTKDGERLTVLGFFHLKEWVKFYEDGAGLYPSWYDPAYPMPPKPGAAVTAWVNKKVLPTPQSRVRGAFGWYAGIMAPNSHSQWTHGTIGWGQDKDKYIRATRGFWANLFTDPRSHGCTRADNETIAYLRHLLPPGTPVLKIYAIENFADAKLTRYSEKTAKWDYIMTKTDVRKSDGLEADRDAVVASGVSSGQYLEQGTYTVKLMPTVKKFRPGSSGAKSGKNGNVYGLDTKDMRGVFLVDEGRLQDYHHPESLEVGGYGREEFPPFVNTHAMVIQN